MAVKTSTSFGGSFDKIEEQIQSLGVAFDKQMDQLTSTMLEGFSRIDKELEKKASKEDINRLFNLMDKIAKQQEIDDDERLVMGHQLERLDRWVHEVADKIGYKLSI